jgi:hypothetical protein
MSRADIGIYGEELYEQVLPLHGPDPDGLAHDYVGALTSQAVEIDDLARDDAQGRPGWGAILDIDACPIKGLPWLAQIAGVSLRNPKAIVFYNFANGILPQNGSFENSDLSSWAYPNTALTRVFGGTVGDYMGHARAVANGTAGIDFNIGTGEHVRTVWAIDIVACSRPVSLQIQFQNASFFPVSTVTAPASATPGRRTLVTVSPVNTAFTSYRVVMPSALTNETFDVDAAMIGANSNLVNPDLESVYFDGFTRSRPETNDEWAVYARDAIRRQGGKQRGMPDAILSAVEDTLTGVKVARLLERVGGNAYALELVTRPSETPNPATTLAAAMAQKPAGMSLTHTLTEGVIINEGTRTIDTSTGTIDTATLGDVT